MDLNQNEKVLTSIREYFSMQLNSTIFKNIALDYDMMCITESRCINTLKEHEEDTLRIFQKIAETTNPIKILNMKQSLGNLFHAYCSTITIGKTLDGYTVTISRSKSDITYLCCI